MIFFGVFGSKTILFAKVWPRAHTTRLSSESRISPLNQQSWFGHCHTRKHTPTRTYTLPSRYLRHHKRIWGVIAMMYHTLYNICICICIYYSVIYVLWVSSGLYVCILYSIGEREKHIRRYRTIKLDQPHTSIQINWKSSPKGTNQTQTYIHILYSYICTYTCVFE